VLIKCNFSESFAMNFLLRNPSTAREFIRGIGVGRQGRPGKVFFTRYFSTVDGISKVGVIGMGLMGHGIAQVSATAGYQVVALEQQQTVLDAGRARIEGSVQKLLSRKVKKGALDEAAAAAEAAAVLGRLQYTTALGDLADCDLVIEAITENPAVKLPLYAELGRLVKPAGVLASNTSSLPVREMADASGRPDRVVGLHFFNPVQLMKLVEVVRTDGTDPAVFERCKAWGESVGKTTVSCRDTPGFIVNRLLVPFLSESMRMVDRGDASVPDIDVSMQLGAGHPMGPLHLADYIGLDTVLSILDGWAVKFPGEPAFAVPACLQAMV
ncbi:unnamed protein product, partial [Heterosigma akashiwo]